MKQYGMGILAAMILCTAAFGVEDPWRQQYRGAEATGKHVIGLWQFLPGAETADNSGRGHALSLRGESRFVENGLFGSCLESFHSEGDKPHGAVVSNRPDLTPKGGFTLELWIRPKPDFTTGKYFFLLDKQYYRRAGAAEANKDYELSVRAMEDGTHLIDAYLGYGEDAAHYPSTPVTIKVGEWSHIAFTYDGAGRGRFFVNGKRASETLHEGRGPVAPGPHPLVIGARVGSTNIGFPGFIDQVRITDGTPPWMAIAATAAISGGRTVFQRMEPGAAVTVGIKNHRNQPLRNLQASVTLNGIPPQVPMSVREIPAAGNVRVEIPVDVSLKPGRYLLVTRFTGQADGEPVEFLAEGTLAIIPRPLPKVFPVVDWGIPEVSYKMTDFDSLKEIGFTHTLLRETDVANYARIWSEGKALVPPFTPDQTLAQMDNHMAEGFKYIASMSPGSWVVDGFAGRDPGVEERKSQYRRINRHGEPYDRVDVCGLFPEVQQFIYNVGESVGQTFGRHPALDGALIHTEVRDLSNPCFHPHDRAAYRAYSGRNIPEQAIRRDGIGGARVRDFVPANGIVADDHPVLDYYRWLWSEGDGWNALNTQLHRGLKTGTHPGFWTFNDPAVRCPPRWGSGGEVDVLSHWTYSYPDPLRIGLATDELFAMAAGRPGQQVMKMTQIIWYRTQTAPNLPEEEADRAAWEKEDPEARFLTISPDHLREAFWLKMSRPVQGIMYHGDPSLGMGNWKQHGAYRYTNPETRAVLGELVHRVVVPLGAALMQVPDPQADVAMLESFASSTFGSAGTWGWGSGWVADMHQLLQWARLQPKIVYEETILRDGLDGIRVLVLPNCSVLSRSVYERIRDFQRQGGIIVADQHLASALSPDILIRQPKADAAPDRYKATLQALAGQLREELEPVYDWSADSTDPDVVVRRRRHEQTEYLFAINDKRTFGDYVGHHGLVMEKGLPHEATLSVRLPDAVVYDLLDGRAVQTAANADGVRWKASFGPGEGRVYMISPRPLANLRLDVASRNPTDRAVQVRVRVEDHAGRALPAVVPVKMDVVDPSGAMAEFSGHHAAVDGVAELLLDLAANDLPGAWIVRARELASGKTAEIRFEYKP